MQEERLRRRPGEKRDIKEISERDYRVRLLGTVVDRDIAGASFLLDDGTGRVEVLIAEAEILQQIEEGKIIRVIGKILKDEELKIETEALQDMEGLDMSLYEQVKYRIENLKKGGE